MLHLVQVSPQTVALSNAVYFIHKLASSINIFSYDTSPLANHLYSSEMPVALKFEALSDSSCYFCHLSLTPD